MTNHEPAKVSGVPAGYLAKVVGSLNRSGIVISQRGLHGGSILAKPPREITLYDVVQAVGPLRRIHMCPLGMKKGHGTNLCPLHRHLDDAIATVERAFRKTSIGDLLASPVRGRILRKATKPRRPAPRARRPA